MTYTPEWPSKATTPAQGLLQHLPSTWKEDKRKPDQDALKKRVAAIYAGKNSQRTP